MKNSKLLKSDFNDDLIIPINFKKIFKSILFVEIINFSESQMSDFLFLETVNNVLSEVTRRNTGKLLKCSF